MNDDLKNSLSVLKKGGLLLYPTATVWGIGCDATNHDAVQKIFDLKKREDSKTMICLVNSVQMLNQYIEEVPESAYPILKYANTPTTIIYDRPLRVAENLIAQDNTLAIRLVQTGFCAELIKRFKKPIVSTSANLSGNPTPKVFKEIENEILKGVDYVVTLERKKKPSNPSSIIKLSSNGEVKVIR